MSMLAILPLISLVCLSAWMNNARPTWGWRHSLLRALIIWGIWIIATTELLSLLEWITPLGLSLSWGVFLAICLAWLFRHHRSWSVRPPAWFSLSNSLFLIPLAIIFLMTAVVAWLAAPDIVDSLNYHLPRVAHWAQNQSVAHFATGIEQQNSRPPFAEYAILHFYVLGQGNRMVNFVEWLAMFGSVIGASLVAARLGANHTGQFLAAVFVATLPMGIIQASSTMNDYVVGLWMICVVVELLQLWQGPKPAQLHNIVLLASAAGLAIATKPIAYAYLLPFAIATAVLLIKNLSLKQLLLSAAVGVLICVALNAGYMMRNTFTYGNPIDPGQTTVHANEMRTLRGLASNIMRNAGLQLSTPWQPLNYQISRLIQAIHFKMQVALDDPRTTAHGEFWIRPVTAEVPVNTAPNWLHAYLLGAICIAALVWHKKVKQVSAIYIVLVLMTFVVFSYLFKWQIFGSRYHLPFFVLLGAAAGVLLNELFPKWIGYPIALVLILSASWPILGHQDQPLLPLLQSTTLNNALSASHQASSYRSLAYPGNPYQQVTDRIQSQDCKEIFLMLGGNSEEYLWWVMSGAPEHDLRIEWLVSGTPSAVHENTITEPCAVICENCTSWDSVRDIPKVFSAGNFDLYMSQK